jgi:hypothetical protein
MKRVQVDSADDYPKFALRNQNFAILLCAMSLALSMPAEAQQPSV